MSGRHGRQDETGEPPRDSEPPEINRDSAQTRELVRALERSQEQFRGDFRSDIIDIKTRAHADFFRLLWVFGAGFVLLATMFLVGYLRLDDRIEAKVGKIDDRLVSQGTVLTHTSTQLDDLLARIPPVQTPAPRR